MSEYSEIPVVDVAPIGRFTLSGYYDKDDIAQPIGPILERIEAKLDRLLELQPDPVRPGSDD